MAEIEITFEKIGAFPPFFKISDFLWGSEANIDSDGDSVPINSINWTELTLQLRSELEERIDIDPLEGSTGFFKLRATNEELAKKTISFLREYGAIR